jgi:hypothetical protein
MSCTFSISDMSETVRSDESKAQSLYNYIIQHNHYKSSAKILSYYVILLFLLLFLLQKIMHKVGRYI